MSIIQIPINDPSKPEPPPPPDPPLQGDLFDSRGWESAFRDLHATPTLLVQLQDDLSRSRMREAFWISVVFHMVVVITLLLSPKFDKWFPHHGVLLVNRPFHDKELTFLEAPPNTPKATKRPDTNIISDKDRIAMSRRPHIDPDELKKILDSGRPGPPAPPGPPAQQPQPGAPAVAQNPAPPAQQPQQAQGQGRAPAGQQTAKLRIPEFGKTMSAEAAIAAAARASAASRSGYGGAGGDYGMDMGSRSQVMGPVDVLSDTQGVDFGPYLDRVVHDVRINWYNLIPEVARPPIMKKGKVAIEFAILKDGSVSGLQRIATSGDIALDRAAWGGITASNPFPPLPSQFGGQYLALRFYFYYNPDANDLR